MNIEEFAKSKGLILLIKEKDPFSESDYKYSATLADERRTHVIYGVFSEKTKGTDYAMGFGDTKEEAVLNYIEQVQNKKLSLFVENKPIFKVPELEY